MNSVEQLILSTWDAPETRNTPEVIAAIEEVVAKVDAGELRTAEPLADGSWQVNEWVKKAIVMYFPIRQMAVSEVGIFEYHDKMRSIVVPPGKNAVPIDNPAASIAATRALDSAIPLASSSGTPCSRNWV